MHLPDDEPFQRRFPHQLSGGQQQRVVIGMATALEPPVVIFDEPTTGLDVVTQAHVLAEIRRLLDESGMSAVYVSHDLAVVAQLASRVVVMYGGRIVEEGSTDLILRTPSHPYTVSLIACTPDHRRATKLKPVRGVPPAVADRPSGCPFRPRCDHASERCLEDPPLEPVEGADHHVACFHRLRSPDLSRAPREGSPEGIEPVPVLTVTDVTARYRLRRGDVVAARRVSFTVARGECVALVGESGSGKTTLGRVIVGLHPPRDGTVALHGNALAPRPERPQPRGPPADPVRLPKPLRLAQPEPSDRRPDRAGGRHPARAEAGRRPRARRRRFWTRCGSPRGWSSDTRRSSPVASASGSRSPAR